ncbi:hypothetical protein GXW82_33195 [Streptacidiphilus sp. 4-A2]|nr:hypothetical protein [Streptacidiphilus sp. 4-A2]
MISWADALAHHSPLELLTLLEQERQQIDERARTLDTMIDTVRGVVDSEPLWQMVAIPGPREAPATQMPATDGAPFSHRNRTQSAAADRSVTVPPPAGPCSASDGADRAEQLAMQADQALGTDPDAAPQDAADASEDPTKRERIIALMLDAPNRWWSALDLCEQLGVSGQRRMRGPLNTMIRHGELVRRKQPGKKHVFYRLARRPLRGSP